MSDEEVKLVIIICERMSHAYAIGPFTAEDIQQEAFIMAMDAYSRWDRERPLENFISNHLSRRLKNFVRDKYYRKRLTLECDNLPEMFYEHEFDTDISVFDTLKAGERKLALKIANGITQSTKKRTKIREALTGRTGEDQDSGG